MSEQVPISGTTVGFVRPIYSRRRTVLATFMLAVLGIALAVGGYLYDAFGFDDIMFTLIAAGAGCAARYYHSQWKRREVGDAVVTGALALAAKCPEWS